jgi:fumarate reductase flavoprotein subunit
MAWDLTTDVVVVGAGGCGMAAALAAAQQGAEVVLLEKDKRVSGNTALSQAMIPAAGTRFQRDAGVQDSPDRFAEDIFRKNKHESNPVLTHTICQNSARLVEWLVDDIGVNLSLVTDFKYPGHSTYRMHATPSRTGEELVNSLLRAISAAENIFFISNAPVHDLIAEDGVVIGVAARSNPEERIQAQKIILAAGGFGRNSEMVHQYCPEIANAPYYGHEGDTGEALLWGMRLGAATENMTAFQGHASVTHPHGILLTWASIMNGGIQVNKDGLRYGDETKGYSEYALEVLAQPGRIAFNIFDQRIYDSLLPFDDFRECIAANAVQRGESLEELAQKLGIDASQLERTLQEFHAGIKAGQDSFGRTIFGKTLQPPFYGARVTGALFHTQGGLKINSYAQVTHPDGQPLPNLYAGGGVAVGVSGKGSDGYLSGNGLLTALGWGMIAGEHAGKLIAEQGGEPSL